MQMDFSTHSANAWASALGTCDPLLLPILCNLRDEATGCFFTENKNNALIAKTAFHYFLSCSPVPILSFLKLQAWHWILALWFWHALTLILAVPWDWVLSYPTMNFDFLNQTFCDSCFVNFHLRLHLFYIDAWHHQFWRCSWKALSGVYGQAALIVSSVSIAATHGNAAAFRVSWGCATCAVAPRGSKGSRWYHSWCPNSIQPTEWMNSCPAVLLDA